MGLFGKNTNVALSMCWAGPKHFGSSKLLISAELGRYYYC